MSQENVELVRQAFEANRSGSFADTVEKALALADPDCEFTSRLTSVEGAAYRGHDGVRAYFEDLADAFQEWHNDLDEITDVGPDAVLTEGTFRATGKSGVNVELRSAMVWMLSNGRVAGLHAYPSREAALEAAGLSE
jgi:ketosteroid isomerase-like protein